jgi:hypothetical protein
MLGPRALLDGRVQETGIVFSTLFGMAVDLIRRWIEGIEFFRDEFPFVARICVFPE